MPFDALATAAMADELRAMALGGRVQKMIQPSALSVGLEVYGEGKRRWLLLSADTRYARVQLAGERFAKAFATPSPFVMLLRKYLDGVRIIAIEHEEAERSLALVFAGRGHDVRLIAEIMGRHSNVILVDASDRILGSVKRVSSRESRIRPIAPGLPFHPPPAQPRDERIFPAGPRLNPIVHAAEAQDLLDAAPPATSISKALLGLLAGCGPFLADQIAGSAGFGSDFELGAVDCRELVESAAAFYRLYGTREWDPHSFVNRQGKTDFAPYKPLGVTELHQTTSLSEAVEISIGGNESHEALSSKRSPLISDLEHRMRAVDRRIESLKKGLEAADESEAIMERGQLILAYQYAAADSAHELVIDDLGLTIPLDPTLTAVENAERTFKRYRKLRDARKRIPPLLQQASAERERLEDIRAFAQIAQSEAELDELARQAAPTQRDKEPGRAKRAGKRGPLRFTRDGHRALVGRNARENEEVTFHLAGRDEVWLHARGRTGAHVIVNSARDEVSDHLLEAAASLAAYFSEGRSDRYVDVDVARVRDVRKIPGGPPGRVTYRNERTVRAQPSVDGWEPDQRPR